MMPRCTGIVTVEKGTCGTEQRATWKVEKAPLILNAVSALETPRQHYGYTFMNVNFNPSEVPTMAITSWASPSLFIVLISLAFGDLAGGTEPQFGLPFDCGQDEKTKTWCLADSAEKGKTVVLLTKDRVCEVRAANRFMYDHPAGPVEATRLEGVEMCGKNVTWFDVGIVGIDPAAVRVLSPRDGASAKARDKALKLRDILAKEDENEPWPLSDSPATILHVGHVRLFIFPLKGEEGPPDGPVALLSGGAVTRLDGWCTAGHVFFTINDKLYLTYRTYCCGCGWHEIIVYDLSGGVPKKVYCNGCLSM